MVYYASVQLFKWSFAPDIIIWFNQYWNIQDKEQKENGGRDSILPLFLCISQNDVLKTITVAGYKFIFCACLKEEDMLEYLSVKNKCMYKENIREID